MCNRVPNQNNDIIPLKHGMKIMPIGDILQNEGNDMS